MHVKKGYGWECVYVQCDIMSPILSVQAVMQPWCTYTYFLINE